MTSTVVQTGTVKSTSYDFTSVSGVIFEDFVSASYYSYLGDSGGLVFSMVNNDYVIAGVHHGRVGFILTNAVFSKAGNIFNEFNLANY